MVTPQFFTANSFKVGSMPGSIHSVTISMAADAETAKKAELGWPGDLKSNGTIRNVSDFVNILVRNDYLKPGDLKVFSAAGIPAYESNQKSSSDLKIPLNPPFLESNCAFKIYLVKKDDPQDTIFMATKNFTYGKPLDPKAKPFGDKGFVVFRKGGDGSILKPQQAQNFELIGKLPGGATFESAENCLNPGP